MLVCNGQTPCPTLYAEEGDIVELHVQNDLYAQSSIHWYVIKHREIHYLLQHQLTMIKLQVWHGIPAIHKVRNTAQEYVKHFVILSI